MSNHIGATRCFCCQTSTVRGPRRRGRRPIISYLLTEDYVTAHPSIINYAQSLFGDRQITAQDRICRPCLQRADRYVTAKKNAQEHVEAELLDAEEASADDFEPSAPPSSREQSSDPEEISENISTMEPQNVFQDISEQHNISQSHVPMISVPEYKCIPKSRMCIIGGCNARENLHRIHTIARSHILSKQHVFIQRGSRICAAHLKSGALWNDDFASLCHSARDTFNSAQISDMLKLLMKYHCIYLNFERLDSIDDSVFYFYIGYSKDCFVNILKETPSISKEFKTPKLALATVLCKLHTGEPNRRLSTIFRLTLQDFEVIMKTARRCLITQFVPKHLGFDHLYGVGCAFTYRKDLRERILRIPNMLFSEPNGRQLISICDGTYFYIQKTSNDSCQTQSYSSHKYQNLLKVFMIVSPDGYIIESFGPYGATKSDASIMKQIIKDTEDNVFHWFYEKDDIFILHRGFEDVIDKITELGYKAYYMPQTKKDAEMQFTAQPASVSRKVTECRVTVETINGRLKDKFRQLRSQNVNNSAPHLYEEIRIACALINAFG